MVRMEYENTICGADPFRKMRRNKSAIYDTTFLSDGHIAVVAFHHTFDSAATGRPRLGGTPSPCDPSLSICSNRVGGSIRKRVDLRHTNRAKRTVQSFGFGETGDGRGLC